MSVEAAARSGGARGEILAAAARALAAHGYHGMSMRDLARAVGRSPATFYNYFDSKEELLFLVQCRAFESLLEAAQQALEGLEDAHERLYVFVLNHVRTFAAHPDVMRVLVHEASALPPERRAIVRERKQAYFEIAHDIIEQLVQHDPVELERSVYCVFGMLNWMYGWYVPEQHGPPESLARSIYRIALGGLCAPPAAGTELARLERRLDRVGSRPLLGEQP